MSRQAGKVKGTRHESIHEPKGGPRCFRALSPEVGRYRIGWTAMARVSGRLQP